MLSLLLGCYIVCALDNAAPLLCVTRFTTPWYSCYVIVVIVICLFSSSANSLYESSDKLSPRVLDVFRKPYPYLLSAEGELKVWVYLTDKGPLDRKVYVCCALVVHLRAWCVRHIYNHSQHEVQLEEKVIQRRSKAGGVKQVPLSNKYLFQPSLMSMMLKCIMNI